VFDHLKGYDVKLWHVYDQTPDAQRILPAGEWAITGGCDVGLRAITIASFLGFRDLHCFGIDGSGKGAKHAADHPNPVEKFNPCEYEGVTYQTTPGMLAAAQQMWHELDQLPAVKATFYGEGLIQAMAKKYERKEKVKPTSNLVAFAKPETISAEYCDLNAKLHKENMAYGVGGGKHAPTVLKLLANPALRSVLDYGCGKGALGKALGDAGIPIWEYDPAIPEKSESPRPADLVVCTDVLEHVEPDKIDYVLADLARCVKQVGYFVIHTGKSAKTLADGRNAHILQHDKAWWAEKLEKYFMVGKVIEKKPLLFVIVGRKAKSAAA
jgi:2-polyprenyl-3-methyl-5-hydroxy-6-metoxy-1,4-benzoquinol methylase